MSEITERWEKRCCPRCASYRTRIYGEAASLWCMDCDHRFGGEDSALRYFDVVVDHDKQCITKIIPHPVGEDWT